MKRGLVAILVVGGLGLACAWFLLALEDRRSDGALHAASAQVAARDPGAPPIGSDRPATRAEHVSRDAIEGPALSASATALPGTTFEPPPPNGIEILVRLRETKDPVRRARVAYLEWSDLDPIASYEFSLRQDEALERFGRLFETDDAGVVIVPRPRESAVVAAVAGENHGSLDLEPERSGRLLLELEPDRQLFVRVVDARGDPAGDQPVALRVQIRSNFRDVEVARSSAEDGIAVLRHLQRFARDHVGAEFAAGLVLLGRNPVETSFDPTNPPLEPIELVLPPCGNIELLLERADGSPVEEAVSCRIARIRSPNEQTSRHSSLPLTAVGGRAFVSGVELDLDLRVSAWSQHHASASQKFDGPVVPDETVVVRLPLGAAAPLAAGRAVREDGMPLADVSLGAALVHDGDQNSFTSGFTRVRTDAEGRFRLPLQGSRVRAANRTRLSLSLEQPLRGFELVGTATIGSSSAGSEIDLGDVYLRLPPLLASGRVVDQSGKGVPGALITLRPSGERSEDPGQMLAALGSRRHGDLGQIGVTDAEGRFELRDEVDATAFTIQASHADYSPLDPLEIGRGATHVVLTLYASGRIRGRMALDPWVPATSFQLLVFDANGNAVDAGVDIQNDGRFEIGGLTPGAYALAARVHQEETDLARVEGLAVEPLGTSEDPALDPLDLRGKVRVFKLSVQDRDGNAVPWFQIRRSAAGRSAFGAPDYNDGEEAYLLVTAERAVDVRISAEEYRTVELYGVSSDQIVNLRQALPIDVVLPENLRGIAEGCVISISLQRAADLEGYDQLSQSVQEEDRVRFLVGEPGRYAVAFHVSVQSGQGWRSFAVGEDLNLALEVADSDAVQTFELSLPEQALEKTRRQMQR